MGYYGERKYKGLAIVGYIICIGVIGYLGFLIGSLIQSTASTADNAQLGVGIGYVVVLVMVFICAGIQIIPTVMGIVGWVLTAKNNGNGAKRYIILTFLPLVSVGILGLVSYLIYANYEPPVSTAFLPSL